MNPMSLWPAFNSLLCACVWAIVDFSTNVVGGFAGYGYGYKIFLRENSGR